MTCVHRWRIDSPNGTPIVSGTCKHCGAEREFPAFGAADFVGQSPLSLKGSVKHARPAVRKDPATHCVKGHEFTPGNIIVEADGRRRCLTCRRAS